MPTVDDAIAALHTGQPADSLEDAMLDFKQESSTIRETLQLLADTVVCLANAYGGTIILGVADKPVTGGSFLGVSPALSVDTVIRGIYDRTDPKLSVPVAERHEAGRRLLVVTVPRGATHYANQRGLATRRVGTECRPFPPEEQRQAMSARGLYDWSADMSGVGLDGIDPSEMARLRRLLVAASRGDVSRLDDERLLSDLRLTQGTEMTRAGLLLVGREEAIRSAVASYEYAYRYRPSAGAEATSRLRERRPLLAAVERLLDTVEARQESHPLNLRGGVQIPLRDYPTSAVRELVVNGLVHRDYEVDGAVDVEHSPDRLTITSPGGLVFGVTPANILTHPSTPRNRLLLETVTTLQVAERTGQGVDRVYRELLRAGKQPPTYTDDATQVTVTISGGTGNDTFARYVNAELDEVLSTDLEVLLALTRLRTSRSIDADDLAPLVQRSPGDAQVALDRMAHEGLIEPTRRSASRPHPRYALSADALSALGRAVSYHRRSADGIDQKVHAHVAEYGYVTNQTLRRMFDLTVYSARDLLRDLQQRGLLKKLDDKVSGPGVRYGPGNQPKPPTPRKGRTSPSTEPKAQDPRQ